jgi:hypothetical protein
LPAVVCAIVFFLASADRLFTLRTGSINVRFAALLLLVAIAVFAATRARESTDDIRALAIAWLPFVALYAIAAASSPSPAPAMLKLGWFAFDFVAAFAVTALFDARDVGRGYFLSYLVIAAIISSDFVTGFTRGPDHMIGYGQENRMDSCMLVFRPHAFYYEPSFAASGLAFAWALALTRMRDAAPKLAITLVSIGAVALVVMTSRIGWLYAVLAALVVVVYRYRERTLQFSSLARASIPVVLLAGALAGFIAMSDKRESFSGLIGTLGFAQAFERVCPLVADQFATDIGCLSGDARRKFLGECQPYNADLSTEGTRIVATRAAVETIVAHPWLGVGVGRGDDRFIAAPSVANLWLEIALDGGLLSLAAFAFGVIFTLRRWGLFDARRRDVLIVFALWLLIVWPFIQTFPRLDLWIAFWVVLVWTRRGAQPDASSRAARAVTASRESPGRSAVGSGGRSSDTAVRSAQLRRWKRTMAPSSRTT